MSKHKKCSYISLLMFSTGVVFISCQFHEQPRKIDIFQNILNITHLQILLLFKKIRKKGFKMFFSKLLFHSLHLKRFFQLHYSYLLSNSHHVNIKRLIGQKIFQDIETTIVFWKYSSIIALLLFYTSNN